MIPTVRTAGLAAAVVAMGCLVSACATTATSGLAGPGLPKNCPVSVFQEPPPFPTENIGPVRARCGLDISDEECLATLKEQVCRLGGSVVWGVADTPTIEDERKVYRGRAAKKR